MRKKLKLLLGLRLLFYGTVEKFGLKSVFKGPPKRTVLLTTIKVASTGDIVCDHVWLTVGKRLEEVQIGDRISFFARVGEYTKGYKGHREDILMESSLEIDYRLKYPSQIKILKRAKK